MTTKRQNPLPQVQRDSPLYHEAEVWTKRYYDGWKTEVVKMAANSRRAVIITMAADAMAGTYYDRHELKIVRGHIVGDNEMTA